MIEGIVIVLLIILISHISVCISTTHDQIMWIIDHYGIYIDAGIPLEMPFSEFADKYLTNKIRRKHILYNIFFKDWAVLYDNKHIPVLKKELK